MVRNLHFLGRELAFWGDFISVLKRISARNLKNTLKPLKKRRMEVKNDDFWEKIWYINKIGLKIKFWSNFLRNTNLLKIVVFDLQTTFFWFLRVVQISGRNTFENAYKITSKSKFSTQNVQIPYHLHPALSYSLESEILSSRVSYFGEGLGPMFY